MVTRKIYFLLLIVAFTASCKKLDSNPEARDPIYQDFLAEGEKAHKDIDAKEKELEANKVKYDQTPDDSFEKKVVREDINTGESVLEKLRQKQQYYELAAASRLIYDKKENVEAFKRGEEWDPSVSAAIYFKEKGYATQSKMWTRGLAADKPKEEKKASPKEE